MRILRPRRRRRLPLALAGLLLASSAQAGLIMVTDGGDAGDEGTCTLRQAIEAASTDAAVAACAAGNGNDGISFSAALAGDTITLDGYELTLFGDLIIQGSGQIIDAAGASRVLHVGPMTDLQLSEVTLTGGQSNEPGGAIYMAGFAALTLDGVSILGNSSTAGGGGIAARQGNNQISLQNSLVSGNSTAGAGGGIELAASAYGPPGNALTLINSTITGNSAARAGAALLQAADTLTLAQATISGNQASVSGGGVVISALAAGGAVVGNSILAGNSAAGVPSDLTWDGATPLVQASLLGEALATNLGGSGNRFSDNPGLAALADNGGHSDSMALVPGSPALDAGSNNLVPTGLDFDQRGAGFPRILGGRVDMGSYEAASDRIFADGFEFIP